MKRRFAPYGRVPYGEPGFNFDQGKTGPRAPYQKGVAIAAEQQGEIECSLEQPAWMDDGDYWVFTVLEDRDDKPYTVDHIALGVRNGVLFAWMIQENKPYQGDGALRLLPDGFDWLALDPAKQVMDLSRGLFKMTPTYPDMEWTLTARIKGREPIVLGTDSELIEMIEGKLGAN